VERFFVSSIYLLNPCCLRLYQYNLKKTSEQTAQRHASQVMGMNTLSTAKASRIEYSQEAELDT